MAQVCLRIRKPPVGKKKSNTQHRRFTLGANTPLPQWFCFFNTGGLRFAQTRLCHICDTIWPWTIHKLPKHNAICLIGIWTVRYIGSHSGLRTPFRRPKWTRGNPNSRRGKKHIPNHWTSRLGRSTTNCLAHRLKNSWTPEWVRAPWRVRM